MRPQTVALGEAPLLKSYQDTKEERTEALIELQSTIFRLSMENLPEAISRIHDNPLLTCGTPDHGVTETINAIAAAAAVQMKTYEPLWALVEGLVGDKFADIGFRVTIACLERYIDQTLFFVLGLITRGLVTICPVFRFLKRRGALKASHLAAFLYFGPELQSYKSDWYREMWNLVHAPTDFRSRGYNPKIISVVAPDFPENLDEVDWNLHKEKRRSGDGQCEFLRCIKNDDNAQLQRIMDDNYNHPITYSIYEQFFKFPYEFSVSENSVSISTATIIDAVLLHGAEKCFKYIVMNCPEETLKELLACAVKSLGSGANLEMVRQVNDLGITFRGALTEAVRFHNTALVQWLLDGKEELQLRDLAVAIKYANMDIFAALMREKRSEILSTETHERDTAVRDTAKVNAIEMFKYLLSEITVPFSPYVGDSANRTFLHWAAITGSEDVARFWCQCFGNAGLDAVDGHNLNPQHYAFISVVYPKPKNPSPGMEVSKPFYMFLKKRSRPDFANDQAVRCEQ